MYCIRRLHLFDYPNLSSTVDTDWVLLMKMYRSRYASSDNSNDNNSNDNNSNNNTTGTNTNTNYKNNNTISLSSIYSSHTSPTVYKYSDYQIMKSRILYTVPVIISKSEEKRNRELFWTKWSKMGFLFWSSAVVIGFISMGYELVRNKN